MRLVWREIQDTREIDDTRFWSPYGGGGGGGGKCFILGSNWIILSK